MLSFTFGEAEEHNATETPLHGATESAMLASSVMYEEAKLLKALPLWAVLPPPFISSCERNY